MVCAIGSRSLTLEFEGVRQDAFDRDKFNGRLQFQIAFDAHQIQGHEILARPHPGPLANGLRRQHAVGLDLYLLDGKCVVVVDQACPTATVRRAREPGRRTAREKITPRPMPAMRKRAARVWLERNLTSSNCSRSAKRRFFGFRWSQWNMLFFGGVVGAPSQSCAGKLRDNSSPAAAAASGSMLNSVMPGRVLTSRTTGSPEGRTITSTRA